MSEQQWTFLLEQLAGSPAVQLTMLCVGCWYQTHHHPFPEQATSTLCPTCVVQTRATYHHGHVSMVRAGEVQV